MESRLLKPYKGFNIEKSYEEKQTAQSQSWKRKLIIT